MNGSKFLHYSFSAPNAAEIREVEQGISFVRQGQPAGSDDNSIEGRNYGFFMISQGVTDQGQPVVFLDPCAQGDSSCDNSAG